MIPDDPPRYWCRRCNVGGASGPCWLCGETMPYKTVVFHGPYIFEAAWNV